MNIFLIHSPLDNLQIILNTPLYIGGKDSDVLIEIEHNLWCLSLAQDAIFDITALQLISFLDVLMQKRLHEVRSHTPLTPILFYVWFDKQALQLRINCISETEKGLPMQNTFNYLSREYS